MFGKMMGKLFGRPAEFFRLKKRDLRSDFKGRWLTCYPTAEDARRRTNGERLRVEHIIGNMRHVTMFQVNGSHLVSMLDAYSEAGGEPLPDRETHEAFLSTVMTHIQPEGKPREQKH